jgi:hypothetical protein
MPFFMLHANRTIAQIRKADGFRAGAVQRDADQTFWTMTLWRDELAMRAFGASGAHRKAMPHLAEWADEAIGRAGGRDDERLSSAFLRKSCASSVGNPDLYRPQTGRA